MDTESLLKQCEGATLKELDEIISELKIQRRDLFNSMYKIVEVFPGVRIEDKIEKETGFACYHKPVEGYTMGRGTHCIVIPVEQYTEELKKKLVETYDNL